VPGQPWSVLGSPLAAAAVAGLAALTATSVVSRLSLLRADWSPRAAAVRVGAAYAVVTLGLWAVVRAVFYPSSFSGYGGALVFWLALAGVGAAVLAGGTTYAYVRRRYLTALLALFAATAFTWYVFLHVGGETDVLWIWGFVFAPVLVAGTGALLAGEWLVRRFRGRQNNSGGGATA